MLRLLLSSSPPAASSMSSAAALAWRRHLRGIKDAVIVHWKRVNLLRIHRNFLGEDLGHLGTKELQQLENQLDMSLRQIRSTKTQVMHGQISDLLRKEQMLLEANHELRRKLEECDATIERYSRTTKEQNQNVPNSSHHQAAQFEGVLDHSQCNNTLQIGYNPPEVTDHHGLQSSTQSHSGLFVPGTWVL
ncbi:hypothetical protein PRUPE_1G290500 [Prunus persica]|uniref:K-box domain-containing protein n=1 Tax=Prunus persica TaxID=3760 RepID=A0A251R4X0_PRUPE|nr:hypothetical protein PRUPE_1G290500 [Prunus persica]